MSHICLFIVTRDCQIFSLDLPHDLLFVKHNITYYIYWVLLTSLVGNYCHMLYFIYLVGIQRCTTMISFP